MSFFLYTITVVIWGLTWFAISLQLGTVPVEQSIVYRFGLAAAVLFTLLIVTRKRLHLPKQAHLRLLGQGLCLFSLNFICFYFATEKIPSGLVSVVFSLATLLNVLNNRLFFKSSISTKAVVGGLMGLLGLGLLLVPTLENTGNLTDIGLGILLSFCGTYCFSLGNMIGKWNAAHNIDVTTGNAFAMTYGTLVLIGFTSFFGSPYTFDFSMEYVGALFYLAIPGSVIGFTAYLMLVGRIGPEKAAYTTVLFPVIALGVSSVFEGYNWNSAAISGLVIILSGNIVTFSPPGFFSRLLQKPRYPAETG